MLAADEGQTIMSLKSHVLFGERFSLMLSVAKPTRRVRNWRDGGGRQRHGVGPDYPGDCESVLFTHESVGALLALASKVPIGETAAVEAIMSIAV